MPRGSAGSTRPEIVQLIRQDLRERHTVVAQGPAGIGKSHLAHRAAPGALRVQCLAAFQGQSPRPLSHATGTP